MDDMAATLNFNGNQRIASLECSLLDPLQREGSDATLSRAGNNDERLPGSNTSNQALGEDRVQETNASFDMDLSGGGTSSSAIGPGHLRQDHVYGRVEVLRGSALQDHRNDGDDEGMAKKRRRLAGAPMVQRFVNKSSALARVLLSCRHYRAKERYRGCTADNIRYYSSLPYPLPDSFPGVISPTYIESGTTGSMLQCQLLPECYGRSLLSRGWLVEWPA